MTHDCCHSVHLPSAAILTSDFVYAQDMISKLGSQMQVLMDASQQQPVSSPAVRRTFQAVEPPAVAPAPEADVVAAVGRGVSHTVTGKAQGDSRQEQQTSDEPNRPISPLQGCPTPERTGPRQRRRPLPLQLPLTGTSSTTDGVLAKIHSLALLLEPDGLDTVIADLQQLQLQPQQQPPLQPPLQQQQQQQQQQPPPPRQHVECAAWMMSAAMSTAADRRVGSNAVRCGRSSRPADMV
jgi:hypothetical protein